MRSLRGWVTALLALALAGALAGLVAVPAGAAGSGLGLHPCDLGLPRPFRCGHLTLPRRRADPSLGTTKVAFAVRTRSDREHRSLGTIMAMDGGPGYGSTAPPFTRRCSAGSRARTCTWWRTAATPPASTSPSARRRWA